MDVVPSEHRDTGRLYRRTLQSRGEALYLAPCPVHGRGSMGLGRARHRRHLHRYRHIPRDGPQKAGRCRGGGACRRGRGHGTWEVRPRQAGKPQGGP